MLDPLLSSAAVLQEVRTALGEIERKLPAMEVPEGLFSDDAVHSLLLESRAALLTSTGKTKG